jgi:hypothetical protein
MIIHREEESEEEEAAAEEGRERVSPEKMQSERGGENES